MAEADGHGYNVRDPEVEEKLRRLGRKIGMGMPKGWGFTLMMFSYGEKGSMFYISSAQRDDMIRAMQEFIQRETM